MMRPVYQTLMSIKSTVSRLAPHLLSVLRIVAAFLYIAHGTQKLFGFPVSEPRPSLELFSLMGAAGIIETFGGLLMLLGLFTAPVAFVLSGQMAVAYFQAHFPRGFWPILNGGELATLYCFLWLFFAAAGAGPISLDALLFKRRS
jgi:putative oxidoreductase